jgi:hypothetical protein
MDKRAIKILLDKYWCKTGWTSEVQRQISPENFNYAKSKGVMFDPISSDHDDEISRLLSSIKKLNRRRVADAFLASLTTRRLDWRSALGSYAVFQHFVSHSPQINNGRCSFCGIYSQSCEIDLNILNFERFKWGGVRHDVISYAALDLELFLAEPVANPTVEDIEIFKNILSAIDAVPSNVTSAALQSHLAKTIKSNKAERDILIGILGYCGILGTSLHSGYSATFTPSNMRPLPNRHFVDMPYPVCWWTREDGVNQLLLSEYFGHVL